MKVVWISRSASEAAPVAAAIAEAGGEIIDVADLGSALAECRQTDVDGLLAPSEVMNELIGLGEEARGRLRHAVLNHLTPILGYAQVLEREAPEEDETRRRLASIVRHALAIRGALDPARRSGR